MKRIRLKQEEIAAILDGRKSEKRIPVKPQPDEEHSHLLGIILDSTVKGTVGLFGFGSQEYGGTIQYAKPPYKVDNILYVQETFCRGKIDAGEEPDGREVLYVSQRTGEEDCIPREYVIRHSIGMDDVVWEPSVHMTQKTARIFLKVTGVRVERLQEMSHDGAMKEGCALKSWWNLSISEKELDKYGWEANPWVYVITFEQISKEEAEVLDTKSENKRKK